MAHLIEKQHSDTQTRELGNRSMPASWGGNTGKEQRLGEGGTKTGLDSIYRKCFQSFASHCEAARNPGFLLQHQLHRKEKLYHSVFPT